MKNMKSKSVLFSATVHTWQDENDDDDDKGIKRWESQITRESLTQSQPFVVGLMSVVYLKPIAIGDI